MKTGIKRTLCMCLALCTILTLTGCFNMNADQLYSLPKASEEYIKLQKKIDAILDTGAEYSPPTSGQNRQSVQLKDLDGDGVQEALAFFRVSGEMPLRIYIFKKVNDDYEKKAVIEGDGTAIDSISYADMSGDGTMELVIGWQMSAELKHMTIYEIKNYQPVQIASADYSELTVNDLDQDGRSDVLALRLSNSVSGDEAELFRYVSDGKISSNITKISSGIDSIERVSMGKLMDGTPDVIVDGKFSPGISGKPDNSNSTTEIITDIIAWRDGLLADVTLDSASGVSQGTVRMLSVYSSDINGDGIVDVPHPTPITSQDTNNYYLIDWYSFDSDGKKQLVDTTYHNYADGWYLILPGDWRDKITVRRDDTVSGERTMIFSCPGNNGQQDFLKIFTLSGDNRHEREKLPGRFTLLEEGDTIYAAQLLQNSGDLGLTCSQELIQKNFRQIYSDWITGVI